MEIGYKIVSVLSVIVAIIFSLLIFVTGKGDAMSGGGGSVRTTFKGKAGFDDFVSRLTLIMGGAFVLLMLALNVISQQIFK